MSDDSKRLGSVTLEAIRSALRRWKEKRDVKAAMRRVVEEAAYITSGHLEERLLEGILLPAVILREYPELLRELEKDERWLSRGLYFPLRSFLPLWTFLFYRYVCREGECSNVVYACIEMMSYVNSDERDLFLCLEYRNELVRICRIAKELGCCQLLENTLPMEMLSKQFLRHGSFWEISYLGPQLIRRPIVLFSPVESFSVEVIDWINRLIKCVEEGKSACKELLRVLIEDALNELQVKGIDVAKLEACVQREIARRPSLKDLSTKLSDSGAGGQKDDIDLSSIPIEAYNILKNIVKGIIKECAESSKDKRT